MVVAELRMSQSLVEKFYGFCGFWGFLYFYWFWGFMVFMSFYGFWVFMVFMGFGVFIVLFSDEATGTSNRSSSCTGCPNRHRRGTPYYARHR
jgi:hypothetical protein